MRSSQVWRRFGVRTPADYNTGFRLMTQPQKKTRRQMLEEFVATHPDDAFARYGLAMDCANAGDSAAADQHFQMLIGLRIPNISPPIFNTVSFSPARDAPTRHGPP